MLEFINEELASLQKNGLYRHLKTIEKIDGRRVTIGGKSYLLFCSNNYLGLAQHPLVIEKAIETLKTFGFGAGASRLICGNTILHEELEKKIACFKGRESALVFPSGYMANLGAISSLTTEEDTIIIDRLNHASIIDGCRLSKAKLRVYPHKDMETLEKILKRSQKFKRRLIVTDSIFSMDGDLAPLPQIVRLAKKYKAITMIDEAHATGVLGGSGRGAEEHFGITGQVDIVMGTLSKALGSLGGFIAGSRELIEYLRNKARSFIYTTALPPSACAAALAALEITQKQPELRIKLWKNTNYLKQKLSKLGYNLMNSESQIIPVFIGNLDKTMEIADQLFKKGIFLSGIRPPTVPKDACRLRLTTTALHEKQDLDSLFQVLHSFS